MAFQKMKFLDVTRIHDLLEAAKAIPRDFALLHLAASTALRSSDILKLKIKDVIDSDGRIVRSIRVKMQKTARCIERPLRDDCREAIRLYLATRQDENPWLFCGLASRKNPRPLHRFSYHKIIKHYLRFFAPRSALRGCATHTLRRSIAKAVYKQTGQITVAQKLLGHTSPANTGLYIDAEEIKSKADQTVLELGY